MWLLIPFFLNLVCILRTNVAQHCDSSCLPASASPPENVTAYNTSSTSLEITWSTVPKDLENGSILGYIIYLRKIDEIETITVNMCSEMSSFSLNNLAVFTNYCIQMSAFTMSSIGNRSDCFFCSTDEEAPGHPPADLSVFNTSSTSIKVEWSPVPAEFRRGIILGYRVFLTMSAQNGRGRRKRDLSPNGNVTCSETTNLTTEFQGLEMYSNYCVEAVAYNRVGESGRTNVTCTLTDEAVPSQAPRNLIGHNTSSTSLVIGWSSIEAKFIHGILLGYKIFYRRSIEPDTASQTLSVNAETLRKGINGLLKYKEYCTKVVGFTRKGDGKFTDCLNITTAQDKPSSAPPSVVVSSYESPHRITLSWEALPQGEINGRMTGYQVEYQMIGQGGEPVPISKTFSELVLPNMKSFVLNNLSVFTSFKFRIAAVTEAGIGVFSEEVIGETCRCEKGFSTTLKPTALDENGVLREIIIDVIEQSCGQCQDYGKTQLRIVEKNKTESEVSFPVTASSVRVSEFSKYIAVIQVPGMLVIKRRNDNPGMYQKVLKSSVFDNWPIFVFALLTMVLAGMIIWILDFSEKGDSFPRSFIKGVAEGFWWSFITMTTVGYGDRFPKGVLAKAFAILWFLVGLIIFTFFGSAVTALMTVTVITGGPTLTQTKTKVSAVANSTEFNLAAKTLSGKWEIGKPYSTIEDLVNALRFGKTDAIFVDMYLPTKRPDWFNGSWYEVEHIVETDMSYGIVLRGQAMKLHRALKDLIRQNNVQSKYLTSGDETAVVAPVHSHDTTFFEVNSPFFIVTILAIISMFSCAVVCGLMYEILRRRRERKRAALSKRKKEALSYELREVVQAFRDSFSARFSAMKRKHKRQLKYLSKIRGGVIQTYL